MIIYMLSHEKTIEEIREGLEDFGDEESTTIFNKLKGFLTRKK